MFSFLSPAYPMEYRQTDSRGNPRDERAAEYIEWKGVTCRSGRWEREETKDASSDFGSRLRLDFAKRKFDVSRLHTSYELMFLAMKRSERIQDL